LNKIEIIGFHATSQVNVDCIIRDGFIINTKRCNEWLGYGIYLFKYKVDAESWGQGAYYCRHNPKIIKCYVEVEKERYLDLDDPEKLNDYFKYYNELLVALSIENKVIEFKTKEEAMCWGLNIYKRIENIDVIKYTFTGNRTKKIMGYTKNKLGYKYNEVQICISRNDVIVKKEICS